MNQTKEKYRVFRAGAASFLFLLLLLVWTAPALAAQSASIKVTSTSCEKGQNVTVSVTVSTTVDMGAYQYILSYDTSMLQYLSGDADLATAGKLQIIKGEASGTSQTLQFTFKSLAVGSAKISVSDYMVCPTDIAYGDVLPTSVSAGTVTINAPYQASANANLKSLSVGQGTLSPAFSKTVYEYALSVGGGVERITVSASPEDAKASVKVSGNTNLKVGENTVTVKVTAEDGKTTKTYRITVTRAKPSPTPSPTPTLSPLPTPTPTPGILVTVGEQKLTLSGEITVPVPEGFEEATLEYENVTVPALRSLSGDLLLVQMSDEKLYLWRAADNTFVRYQVIVSVQASYTILPLPALQSAPQGYIETKKTIGGEEFSVYVNREDSGVYLFYGMNWDGSSSWYRYDSEDGSVQRFLLESESDEAPTPTVEPSPTVSLMPTPTTTPTLPPSGQELAAPPEQGQLPLEDWILLSVSGVLFCLTLLFLSLYLHERNRHVESVDTETLAEASVSVADLELAAVAEEKAEPEEEKPQEVTQSESEN